MSKAMCVGCTLLFAGTIASAHSATSSVKKSGHKQSSTKSNPANSRHSKSNQSANTTTHITSRKGKRSRKSAANWKRHGQQKIDSNRARQIQEALIREHYLPGQPTGVWDQESQKAMERYQTDNGWQSKTVPDARALIKLGLGPSHDHLLNPESAITTPIAARTNPPHAHPGAPVNPATAPAPPPPAPDQPQQ